MRDGDVGLRPRARAAALALGTAALGGCVIFMPETTNRYNPACGTMERHMELRAYQTAAFVSCRNEGCAELLVLAGAVSAASLVVSGSIAVVGDIVYWLEAVQRCPGK